ncbi:MAG: type II secretion system protein [Gammaproteobacteria bacterium]|nr:MAG: type II secretion system protein [Gammaproteobacteria bacterium]
MLSVNSKFIIIRLKKANGFSLIELVTVIVILSVLAVLGGQVIAQSTDSYQSTQMRSRLVNTGRQAIERMSRQLRVSLPYGVRITNDGSCLQFMPIVGGGNYLGFLPSGDFVGYVPDPTNGVGGRASISVSPYSVDLGNARYLSIGALSSNELYGTNPVSLAALSSRTNVALNLSSPKVWQRNSINKRFYILDNPQAFCIVASQLRFYSEQNISDINVDTSTAYSLLAENVTTPAPFSLAGGSESRNIVVFLNIAFEVSVKRGAELVYGPESVAFNHSVMIRNVP